MAKILIELDDDTIRKIQNIQMVIQERDKIKISRQSIIAASVKKFLDETTLLTN